MVKLSAKKKKNGTSNMFGTWMDLIEVENKHHPSCLSATIMNLKKLIPFHYQAWWYAVRLATTVQVEGLIVISTHLSLETICYDHVLKAIVTLFSLTFFVSLTIFLPIKTLFCQQDINNHIIFTVIILQKKADSKSECHLQYPSLWGIFLNDQICFVLSCFWKTIHLIWAMHI